MAKTLKVRATQAFVVITDEGYRVVQAGEELAPADEVVKANPRLFEPPGEQTTARGQVR